MLNWFLYRRFGIARVLAVVAAILIAFWLQNFRGVVWYWAWLAALAAYLVVPVLWGVFLGTWERMRGRLP